MNDRDKIELESVLFEHALRSVGLDFGFMKKAEKEAMKQAEKEASSESIEENLFTSSGGIDPKSFEWYLYHIKDRIGIRRKKEKNQRRALDFGGFETGKLNLNTADNFQFLGKILDQIPRSMLTRPLVIELKQAWWDPKVVNWNIFI